MRPLICIICHLRNVVTIWPPFQLSCGFFAGLHTERILDLILTLSKDLRDLIEVVTFD